MDTLCCCSHAEQKSECLLPFKSMLQLSMFDQFKNITDDELKHTVKNKSLNTVWLGSSDISV